MPVRFLQASTVLVGIGTAGLLLWEPHLEGRNAGATPFEVYFHDPFLAYAYLSSILFFVALSRVFTLLGLIGQGRAASPQAVGALRTIRRCGLALAGCIAGAQVWLFVVVRGKDDIAGGVAVSLLLLFLAIVMAASAGVLDRVVRARRS